MGFLLGDCLKLVACVTYPSILKMTSQENKMFKMISEELVDQVVSVVSSLPFPSTRPGSHPISDQSLAFGLGFQSLPDWANFSYVGFSSHR